MGRVLSLLLLLFLLTPAFSAETSWYLRSQPDSISDNVVPLATVASVNETRLNPFQSFRFLWIGENPQGRVLKSDSFPLEAGRTYSLSFLVDSSAPAEISMLLFDPESGEQLYSQSFTANPDGTVGILFDDGTAAEAETDGKRVRVRASGITFPSSGTGAIFVSGRNLTLSGLAGPVSFGGVSFAIDSLSAGIVSVFAILFAVLVLIVILEARKYFSERRPAGRAAAEERKRKEEALDEISRDIFGRN